MGLGSSVVHACGRRITSTRCDVIGGAVGLVDPRHHVAGREHVAPGPLVAVDKEALPMRLATTAAVQVPAGTAELLTKRLRSELLQPLARCAFAHLHARAVRPDELH